MSGPDRPKCVNSISPKSDQIFLLSSNTVTCTLRRLSPMSGAQPPGVTSGTSEPFGGTMVCPACRAKR